eukprot:2278785-Ditylum_brightwellii.AAC.1
MSNKKKSSDVPQDVPQDISQGNLQIEDEGPPHADIKALKRWAQNKADDADEGGAATLSLTASLLYELTDDIKLMMAKRAAVLANKKKETLD